MNLGFNLDPGETVQRIVHRRWVDYLPSALTGTVLIVFAIGLAYLTGRSPGSIPFPASIIASMVVITLILGVLILLVGFYIFRNNYLVFTNLHMVEVEQIGPFGHRVSQINFLNVEDVTGVKSGVFQTIFNYGDVTVQSAGEQEKFIFHNCPDPTGVADDALAMHEQCVKEREQRLGVNSLAGN